MPNAWLDRVRVLRDVRAPFKVRIGDDVVGRDARVAAGLGNADSVSERGPCFLEGDRRRRWASLAVSASAELRAAASYLWFQIGVSDVWERMERVFVKRAFGDLCCRVRALSRSSSDPRQCAPVSRFEWESVRLHCQARGGGAGRPQLAHLPARKHGRPHRPRGGVSSNFVESACFVFRARLAAPTTRRGARGPFDRDLRERRESESRRKGLGERPLAVSPPA